MANSMGLLAAFAGMAIVVLFNTFVLNLSRSNPNNVMVRSDVVASMTALLMTSLIVFAFAIVASRMFIVTTSIPLALGTTVAAFAGMTFLAWVVFGVRKSTAASDKEASKVPVA